MPIFGNKSRFAIGFDHAVDSDSLRVDVWAASTWLTCVDNSVYVPQFADDLKFEIRRFFFSSLRPRPYPEMSIEDNFRRLHAEEDWDSYWFMNWGPTADNVRMLLFCENGTAYLPFEFWWPNHHDQSQRGKVFVAELLVDELALVLHDSAWDIVQMWASAKIWPARAKPNAGSV
jgi:hypothetical protein